jgi:hypothetical protein
MLSIATEELRGAEKLRWSREFAVLMVTNRVRSAAAAATSIGPQRVEASAPRLIAHLLSVLKSTDVKHSPIEGAAVRRGVAAAIAPASSSSDSMWSVPSKASAGGAVARDAAGGTRDAVAGERGSEWVGAAAAVPTEKG